MRIALCAIAKNEAESLPVMLDSVKDLVDEIVIVDTGSDDNTLKVAQEWIDKRQLEEYPGGEWPGVSPYCVSVFKHPKADEWREHPERFSFAEARNYAKDQATADWIISLDCDETLEQTNLDKFRATIEKLPPEVTGMLVNVAMHHDDGTEYQRFMGERLFKREGAEWINAMHNALETPGLYVQCPQFVIHHNRSVRPQDKRVTRNTQRVDMAEHHFLEALEKDPTDSRSMFYLAGTYFDNGQNDKAIPWYEKYLEIAEWSHERYQACIVLARAYLATGEPAKARKVLVTALGENFRRAEAELTLGDIAKHEGDLDQAEWWYTLAALKPLPNDPLFAEPPAHTWMPHERLWRLYIDKQDDAKTVERGIAAIDMGAPNQSEIYKSVKNHKNYGTDKILCLVDRGQMDFLQPLVDKWTADGKQVTCTSGIPQQTPDVDVIWCEWGGPLAIELTKTQQNARVIIRVHGYELHSGYLPQINWAYVDDVIFVADYLKDSALEQCPHIAEWCNVYVVPGGVETDKFSVNTDGVVPVPGKYLQDSDPKLAEMHEYAGKDENGNEWWSRSREYQWVLGDNKILSTDRVLDVGSGKSLWPKVLVGQLKKDKYLTLSDVDQEAITFQNKQYFKAKTILGNDYPENAYDVVTCVSTLEHADNQPGLIKAMYSALKPGGRLLMTFDTPTVDVMQVRRWLMAAGFAVDMPTAIPDDALEVTYTQPDRFPHPYVGPLRVYAVEAVKGIAAKQGNKIAMACYGNSKKNIPLALQILAELPKEYEFHLATTWQEDRQLQYFNHIVNELGLQDRVFVYPWQSDLNRFYADKDYYLSTSIEESFCYSLAEGMACGLKPIIHNWKSAKDFYKKEWIFNTVEEASDIIFRSFRKAHWMPTREKFEGIWIEQVLPPYQEYRDYAVDCLDIRRNLTRIGRIMHRPRVAVAGANTLSPYAAERKILWSAEQLGCRVDASKQDIVFLMGHEPKLEPWMKDAKKVLWTCEWMLGEYPWAQERREAIAKVAAEVDVVICHHADHVDLLKSMGAKDVYVLPCHGAIGPFQRLEGMEKLYDVGFYGAMNDRRKAILEKLSESFKVGVMTNEHNHENLNRFINQCRVMVNIGWMDEPYLATRLAECMAAGACIVSEPFPGSVGPLLGDETPGTESLIAGVEAMLEEPSWREFGKENYEWVWKNCRFIDQVERALEIAGC